MTWVLLGPQHEVDALRDRRHGLGNEEIPTAFLLFINDVIPENQALNQQSLPQIKMPIGDKYAPLPDWKPRTKRLPGYPY